MGKLAGGFIDVYLLEKSRYICSKSFFFMLGFVKVSLEIKAIFVSFWPRLIFDSTTHVMICALRVTYQQPNERCYHIFFQLIEPGIVDNLQGLVLMSTDPYDYFL